MSDKRLRDQKGIRQALEALVAALEEKETQWRDTRSDPHGIATPVMVALTDVRMAINEVLDAK